jgi:hypothetical protein
MDIDCDSNENKNKNEIMKKYEDDEDEV